MNSPDSFPHQKEFAKEGEAVDEAEVEALRRPEDEIPDLPENQAARAFLKNAPSKGLWMPLGKEVKVMQCFRCKAFGHRTGDRECPLAISGNTVLDAERQAREDPVLGSVVNRKRTREEKYERVRQLMMLVEEIRAEERERRARKKLRRERKRERKSRKESQRSRKKSRHRSSNRSSSSSSSSSSTSSSSSSSSSSDSDASAGRASRKRGHAKRRKRSQSR